MTLSIERRKQRSDFFRQHDRAYATKVEIRPTHAEQAQQMYDVGYLDGFGGFDPGWSRPTCQCEDCSRKYDAGYSDGKLAQEVEQLR